MITVLRYVFFVGLLILFQWINIFDSVAAGSTYYVDYTGGSNTNSGMTTLNPWKNSPGDPNATGNPASTIFQSGDTVYFKGGVRYKGRIDVSASGNTGNRIYFDGQPAGWGTGKAIIDGSVNLSWTVCPDAVTCGGNPNFASIYYAALPVGANWQIPVFDQDAWLYHQIDVSLRDPFIYTTTDDWHAISGGITNTSCNDSLIFTDPSSTYYLGSYLQTQTAGNAYGASKITSYNPTSHTVTYADLGVPMADTQWDSKYHYSVVNNFRAINSLGYYAVDEANSRIYAWPRSNSSNLSVGSLPYGFNTNGKSYVTISGFIIMGQYGTVYDTGIAIKGSNSTATNGIIIENCDIKNQVSTAGASANVYMLGAGTDIQYYRNNTMAYAYGRGILAQGQKIYVQNSSFQRSTGTVIWFFSATGNPATNGEISGNTISNSGGLHGNGISLYGLSGNLSTNIVVKNNKIFDFGTHAGPYAVSQQYSYNMTFYNNIFDGEVIDDGPMAGCSYMRYYNNIMIDGLGTNKGFRVISPQNCSEFSVKGNIIDGFLGASNQWNYVNHQYNLYLSKAWNQGSSYGWTDGVGEANTTAGAVFNNAAANDFTPKVGGPAINSFPTASAPTGIFATDVLGTARPQGSAWDIGPYEIVGGGGKQPMYPIPTVQ